MKMKPSNHKLLSYSIGLMLLFSFFACSPKIEAEANQSAQAMASGPFFTGPNSLIAEQNVDLSQLVEGKQLKAEQLKEVKLNSVTISLRESDSISMAYFDNASLSIVSSDLEMQSIATKNPLDAAGQEVSFEGSEDADLVEYFKAGNYSLVLDLGLNEDLYLEELGATIDLKLSVKYKD